MSTFSKVPAVLDHLKQGKLIVFWNMNIFNFQQEIIILD